VIIHAFAILQTPWPSEFPGRARSQPPADALPPPFEGSLPIGYAPRGDSGGRVCHCCAAVSGGIPFSPCSGVAVEGSSVPIEAPSGTAMWKQAYQKVKQQQREGRAAAGPSDGRLQSLECDFFDKLGELMQKHAEEHRLRGAASLEAASDGVEDGEDGEGGGVVPRIEVLYVEVLHTILHTVGCSVNGENDRALLFNYLQAAFKFDDDKHNKLMDQARNKEAPNILLHVEVIEATDIVPMDADGLSDTFCTVYLTSSEEQQYHTTVKMSTLCPEWNEHFCLDFDPAETVQEKVMKVGVVKGIKGWGKFVREFGATGKIENEFIGSCVLPLNRINASGEVHWCDLEKKGKTDKRGRVKVKLAFSTQKSKEAAFKDHRNLLRLLLLHELETTEAEPYSWNGEFVTSAETILTQHLLQSGLPPIMDTLVKWVEYCNVHEDNPLSFEVFSELLEKLLPPLQSSMFDREKEILFWEAAKSLIPSCFNGIKRLHLVLSYLRCVHLPEGFELFPSSMYGWFLPLEDNINCDVAAATKCAIVKGTEEWYNDIIENNINTNNSSREIRLNHIITIIKNAMKNLHLATDVYDKIFQETLQLAYAMTLFSAHGNKISELVEPAIEEVYQVLKPVKFNDESSAEGSEDDVLGYGMQLFDLYLTLQRFVVSGSGISSEETKKHRLSEYHRWFHRSVAQWLDIALWKTLKRIQKAVELDNLVPVSDSVKHSSSAIDTLGIFNQIKIFWQQLAWPDVEGSYVFVAKIIDDICHCSVYYANIMSQRIEQLSCSGSNSKNKFLVSKEWCRAINNIEYIWRSIEPFVSELGMNDVLSKLANVKSSADTEQCRRTLELVIDNAVETVGSKITELLDTLTKKMIPAIHTLLLEGLEMLHKGDKYIDNLMLYLDKNLTILHSELDTEIFQQVLLIMWEHVVTIIFGIVEKSLEEKRSRSYFSNLQRALDILLGFFGGGAEGRQIGETKAVKEVQKLLALHSMDTSQLIHKFYLERLEEQKAMQNSPLGIITIFAEFGENILKIEILSGRNIHPMDSNGSCDPYVEIALLPAEKFIGVPKQKTKTQKKTLFPLFDESFSFELTRDQRETKDGMVLFTVKDKDMLGNELVGEAFISFDQIESDGKNENQDLQQIHLNLSIPKNLDSQVSRTLEVRQGDKLAKEFMKKQKAKASAH
ncbi:Protein unc-13 homolog 4B, partial [Gryllus bimaculatus]